MKRLFIVVGSVALTLAIASAGAAARKDVLEPGKPVAEQIPRIEAELADGKTYAEIAPAQRTQVLEALGRLRASAQSPGSVGGAAAAGGAAEAADRELVNTVLTRAREDSRLICKRERPIGSNFPQTQCMTVAQRERIKNDSQKNMQKAQRVGSYSN